MYGTPSCVHDYRLRRPPAPPQPLHQRGPDSAADTDRQRHHDARGTHNGTRYGLPDRPWRLQPASVTVKVAMSPNARANRRPLGEDVGAMACCKGLNIDDLLRPLRHAMSDAHHNSTVISSQESCCRMDTSRSARNRLRPASRANEVCPGTKPRTTATSSGRHPFASKWHARRLHVPILVSFSAWPIPMNANTPTLYSSRTARKCIPNIPLR